MAKARVIALYLPQYHPIPENDEWWGKGFTEWTNVAKAKPLFRNHYQPKIPADLGFYDLRLPIVREEQAKMAREAGIEGFCYWHYWFGEGKRILEMPFNEVLQSGKPDFPFCLGWANHSWSRKTWTRVKNNKHGTSLLIEQKYLGKEDWKQHFMTVLPAFKDKRYICVDGKPFFMIFDPLAFKEVSQFMEYWRELAKENGLPGIHFVACGSASFRKPGEKSYNFLKLSPAKDNYKYLLNLGFDAVNSNGKTEALVRSRGIVRTFIREFLKKKLHITFVDKLKHSKFNKYMFTECDEWDNVYPTVIPNFDRSPRNAEDILLYESTPECFKNHLQDCLKRVEKKDEEHRIVILKSWNEWGEGNYVEPDIKYGRGFLDAIKEVFSSK